MKVLVLAEYYPRESDPTLGVWAHRQTLAATRAGAEARVLVLHRPVPPLATLRSGDLGALRAALSQPRTASLDGLRIDYLRYLSPPRPWSYASWGAWAAPLLRRALTQIRARFAFDLIHAHYAVPAGDAVRRAAPGTPLLVSVHGGDVLGSHAGAANVRATFEHARRVLVNSTGTAARCRALGAAHTEVVHLGSDLPATAPEPPAEPTLVSVGNLISRKQHADVIEAVALLAPSWAALRYVIVGDGPEREALLALAQARGVADRVVLKGRLEPAQAVAEARAGSLFVMPSVAEAFGVAYVEAMAAGVPAIGCAGEDGPEEIAASGGGIELVAPRDPRGLAATIDALLRDPARRTALGVRARDTVGREFTWERCGRETVAAYGDVLRG
jgi:teichuronic acid biosynthesis glycosyltransferase TuaC